MKLHFELEQSEMQNLMMLVNMGGMLAQQAPSLLQRLSEQIQAQQQASAPRPNGADDGDGKSQHDRQ
jgi:hypothetical protein